MNRNELTGEAEKVGMALEAIRKAALASNYIFMGGLLRGAEQIVLLVFNTLNDTSIEEREL